MADITIDNYSISSTWHGDVLDYNVSQNQLSDFVFTTDFSAVPIPLKGTIGIKKIELTIDFKDYTEGNKSYTADEAISSFMEYLLSKNESGNYIELKLPDGFEYTCSLSSADDPDKKAPWIKQCTVALVGFRHMAERSYNKTADGGYTISQRNLNNNIPCRPTPLYVKFVPPAGIINFKIRLGGTFIICTGISGYIEIDSLNGTVKDSSGNAFHKTDLVSFPFYPGTGSLDWNVMSGNSYAGGSFELKLKPIVL